MTSQNIGQSDEAELIRRSLAGDGDAFGILVERYQGLAINISYRMIGELPLAEDLAQEAFLKAWLNLSSFRGESTFRSWLGRIVTNSTIDYVRRQARFPGSHEHWVAQIDTPAALIMQEETRERVRSAVLSLPMHCRAALVLREYEELSYKEIAQALGIPLGTVMSRLNYARNRLRELLEVDMHRDDDIASAGKKTVTNSEGEA